MKKSLFNIVKKGVLNKNHRVYNTIMSSFTNSNSNKLKDEKTISSQVENFHLEDKKQGNLKIKEFYKPYTKEEYEELIKTKYANEETITLFEIEVKNLNKVKKNKSFSLYVNMPASTFLLLFSESILFKIAKLKQLSGFIFTIEYLLFMTALITLNGLRNIVVSCEYLIKDNQLIFTKLDYFNRPFIVKENVSDLERVYDNALTPFLTLTNKKVGNKYSMTGTGYYRELKLFNYLFPHKYVKYDEIVLNKDSKLEEKIDEKEKKEKDSGILWKKD